MSVGPRIGYGRTAELYAWGDDQVLKLFKAGTSRATVEHEARVSRAVHAAGVASPAVWEVVEVGGRLGIVYERVSGQSMMQAVGTRPWRLPRLARLLADLHAAMHARESADLPAQHERLRDKILRAKPLPARMKEAALQALSQLPSGNAICHGDFHPDNVVLSPGGPVIIDWIDATRGHALGDLARTSLLCRTGRPPGGRASGVLLLARGWFHRLYLQRYLALRPASRAEVVAWELPVAAARLSEEIGEEEATLAAIVERCLKR